MTERDQLEAYARNWEELAPVLRALRDEDIRKAETWSSIPMFDGLFEAAIRELPARNTSGLVDFQDRLRRRASVVSHPILQPRMNADRSN